MSKGPSFERDVCKKLSLWWSEGKSDAVFWRTPNSGGRATVRGKSGKESRNQYGDVLATDSLGEPFLRAFVLELKRGYNSASFQDLMDWKVPNKGACTYGKWLDRLQETRTKAGSLSWMLILRRDRRESLVVLEGSVLPSRTFSDSYHACLQLKGRVPLVVLTLEEFCRVVTPNMIKTQIQRTKK